MCFAPTRASFPPPTNRNGHQSIPQHSTDPKKAVMADEGWRGVDVYVNYKVNFAEIRGPTS